ncbi:MAG: hypothetical protein WHT28_03815 [Fimbriimonadales bacterium]
MKSVPKLELSDDQVIELVRQLPSEKQDELLRYLLRSRWPRWMELSQYGQERIRQIASERGLNWDALSENEREALIDDLVHEVRQCDP